MSNICKAINKYKWGYLFILPWILLFGAFGLYPLLLSFYLTFFTYNFIEPQAQRFVGLGNWVYSFLDPLFWRSVFNICYNQAMFISLTFCISLGVALLLKQVGAGGRLYRTIYFIPTVCSVVVIMTVGGYLSSPAGPIQAYLLNLGLLKEPVHWKFDLWLSMAVLAVINCWKWFGIQTVIFLAGLITIDHTLYEAAELDGANAWGRFWNITIPQLNPQIVFILVMNGIYGLQMFTEVYMNFDLYGGIYNQALTPVLYIYAVAFDQYNMGYASTLGLILTGLIFILTILQFRLIQREID